MRKLFYFLPIILFIVIGIFLYRGIGMDPSEMPSALVDKSFPHFSLPDLDGNKKISEADLQDKVSLVNVWATWCVSCRMEHPYLLELAKQGVQIVGLNYKDDATKAQAWLKELGNPYAFNISDKTGNLGLDLGVFGAPETFVVDKQGIIRHKHVGVIDERVWREELEAVYKNLDTDSP